MAGAARNVRDEVTRRRVAQDVERIARQANADFARSLVDAELRTGAPYRRAHDAIVASLRRDGHRIPNAARLERMIRYELDAAARRAAREVERTVRDAADRGRITARVLAGVQSIQLAQDQRDRQVTLLMQARQAASVDEHAITALLTRRAQDTARELAERVRTTVQAGDGIVAAARELERADDVRVALPRAAERIAQVLEAGGDVGELRRVATQFRAHAERLGSATQSDLSIRGAAVRLARAAESGTADEVRQRLDEFVLRKARYEAVRIARTESARARNAAFVDSVRGSESVVGMRWNLSRSHPTADVCDAFAGADPDGLGAGVYAMNSLPPMPPHPGCLCFWTAEVRAVSSRERRLAELEGVSIPDEPRGTPQSHDEWLRAQSASTRVEILGRTRAAMVMQGASVMGRDGSLVPVGVARGPAGRMVRVVGGRLAEPVVRLPSMPSGRRRP